MKEIAKAYPGATIRNAVVPVSVYFNDPQRQTIKDVSVISRLNVMRIIHVSTTTAYGLGKKTSSYAKKNIFVFFPVVKFMVWNPSSTLRTRLVFE